MMIDQVNIKLGEKNESCFPTSHHTKKFQVVCENKKLNVNVKMINRIIGQSLHDFRLDKYSLNSSEKHEP